jgi:hypothetical protein
MKAKILNVLLILTSLIGYLEWGQDRSQFLFEMELDILLKLISDPIAVLHPFIILPLLGQLMLLITLFQTQPSRILTRIGIICIGNLMLVIIIVGTISFQPAIFFSTLPFLGVGVYSWKYDRNR